MYSGHITAFVHAWNTGEFENLNTYVSESVVRRTPTAISGTINGLTALKEHITQFRTEFPDLNVVINDEIFGENRSCTTWTFTGTNTGPGDLGQTGKSIELKGCSVHRYADGHLTEEDVFFDAMDFLGQLGLIDQASAANG